MNLEICPVRSKTRSPGQTIEESILVTKKLRFKPLSFSAVSQSLGEGGTALPSGKVFDS